jgi:enamine deaminase RidA (YjgF/YER057c/UK114 family)
MCAGVVGAIPCREVRVTLRKNTGVLLLVFAAAVWATQLRAQLPEKHALHPDGRPAESVPWSPAVLVGSTLYLSGAGSDVPGGSRPVTAEGEIRQSFANVRRMLRAAGMDYGNVVSSYVYLTDIRDHDVMDQVFREVFPKDPPVRSTIEVGAIPGGSRILVQAIAVQDSMPRAHVPLPVHWKHPSGSSFSAAVKVNGLVYLSGVGTFDPATGQQPETYALQVRQSLVNMGELLAAAGADFRHVAFVNPYLAVPADVGAMNTVYRQFFEFGSTPARATLMVSGLPAPATAAMSAVGVEDVERRLVVRPISRELSPTASPAVFAGDVLYFSGFSGFTPGYGYVSGSLEHQVRFALRNIQDGLESAGLTLQNVVSVTAYLADAADYDRVLETYAQSFPTDPPALTTVQQSPKGPDNRPLVQFSAIAVRSVTSRQPGRTQPDRRH